MSTLPAPINARLRGEDTDGHLAVVENFIAGFGASPRHVHPSFDETFCVLEGKVTSRSACPLPGAQVVDPPIGDTQRGDCFLPHDYHKQ